MQRAHGMRSVPLFASEGDAPPASRTEASASADEIAERLRRDVARAIAKVCPAWLRDQADDLTQIATTRVLNRIRAADGQLELTAGYIYRAAHSVIVDEIRKRRRLREVSMESEDAGDALPRREGSQFTVIELREAIAACLAKLLAARRRAVMLHLQGHSVVEAGALLDCDRRRAENLIYRGLADLRACLGAQGIAP